MIFIFMFFNVLGTKVLSAWWYWPSCYQNTICMA